MIIKVLSLSFLFSVIYAEVTRSSISSALKESINIPKYSGDPSEIMDNIRIVSKELKHLKFELSQVDGKINQYNLKQDIIDQIKNCDSPKFITTMTDTEDGKALHLDGGYKKNGVLHYFQGFLRVKANYLYYRCGVENVVCVMGLNYRNSSMDYSYIYPDYLRNKNRQNEYIKKYFFEEMIKLMNEKNPEECPKIDYRFGIYQEFRKPPSGMCCVIKGYGSCPPTKEKLNLFHNAAGSYGMKRIEKEFLHKIAYEFKEDYDDDDDDDY